MISSSFVDELEKIAISINQIRAASKRIGKTITPEKGSIIDAFGAIATPTKAQVGKKNLSSARSIARMQSKILPKEVTYSMKKALKPIYSDKSKRGKIYLSDDIGARLSPSASPKTQKRVGSLTKIHERQETKVKMKPGSLHLSPKVMMDEMNMANNITGHGSKVLSKELQGLRKAEFGHLRKQIVKGVKDKRALQYTKPGRKIPKAMKKHLLKKRMRMTPREAINIMTEQGKVLQERHMKAAR